MSISDKRYIELYLDWFNNFLTVARFAEYYDMSEVEANLTIFRGKYLHELECLK